MEALVEQLSKRTANDQSDTQATDRSLGQEEHGFSSTGTGTELPPSPSGAVPDLSSQSQVTGRLDQISRALRELWPSQDDVDIILSVPLGISVLYHGVVCVSYSRFFAQQTPSLQSVLQLPPRGSHPIIIARRLLMLSTFLQGIPPCSAGKLAKMTGDYRTLMSRAVETVSRLVTGNDELVNSLEGIECLMIECMYRNNAGNLRRAWLTNRRAMNMAQMMGLDTGHVNLSPSMIIEESTRTRIDPGHMWFRLVCSDRYLSLILGLPQCSAENVFASPKALESCTPLERLERLESVAGGLILQRNSAEQPDLATTHKIDTLLQEAGSLMPPKWWMMTPDLSVLAGNNARAFEETMRLTFQFTHHHLLVQLHLPYMLQPSAAYPSFEYNKMTAANASRTILTQFLFFRESTSIIAYCRGIDFIVFIASTTLCLAHIEARRQQNLGAGKGFNPLQTLQHQRQNDRGLLERTLETIQAMAETNKDPVASKIAKILQPLLNIESDSAKGGCYQASASLGTKMQESQCNSNTSDVHNVLRIHIPHFGTFKIEHQPPTNSNGQEWSLSGEQFEPESELRKNDPGMTVICGPAWPLNRVQHRTQQAAATSTDYHQASHEEFNAVQPIDIDWRAVLSNSDPAFQPQNSTSGYLDQSHSTSNTQDGTQEDDFLVDFDPGMEAWPLQNVDTALFSSLMRGYVNSSEEISRSEPLRRII